MPWKFEHIQWLSDTGSHIKTADGLNIAILEFEHQADDQILSAWASHFRNHYCLDSEIDILRGTKTRQQFLIDNKFPNSNSTGGPAIRAGDFGEILVADYLEWVLGYWVPRLRWSSKVIRDESLKGCDVIGFNFKNQDKIASPEDIMVVFEAKTKFSKSGKNRLQDAINDSAKDHIRIDESLNFIKQKFLDKGKLEEVQLIQRFQSPADNPYDEKYGAVALISSEFYDQDTLKTSDCSQISRPGGVIEHPNKNKLNLLVIKGSSMMQLVHDLYKRATDEA